MSGAKIYLELFFTFFKIGAVTFGGGLSMLPIIDRELCQKRGWVAQEELIDYYAIGQVTPGIVAVNVATFCGHKLRGTLGGIVATLAIVTPSVIVISFLASCISAVDKIPVIKKALMGINVAVAANLSFSVIKFFKKSVASLLGLALFALAFALVFFFKFSAVLVILASGILGAAIFGARRIVAKPKNAAASNASGGATDSSAPSDCASANAPAAGEDKK